jgi:hypothetical protein
LSYFAAIIGTGRIPDLLNNSIIAACCLSDAWSVMVIFGSYSRQVGGWSYNEIKKRCRPDIFWRQLLVKSVRNRPMA